MRIKNGDKVQLMAGKDKGKSGKVIQVFPQLEKVVVEGVNLSKKHVKSKQGAKGQIVEFSAPIAVSKVMLICPKCAKPTRVGAKVVGGEKVKRVRICKKCEAALE
jgi:large subunit ribosomal protein L24